MQVVLEADDRPVIRRKRLNVTEEVVQALLLEEDAVSTGAVEGYRPRLIVASQCNNRGNGVMQVPL